MKNKTTKKQKIDVYSRFSEENIEFVSKQDERDVICSILDLEDNLFNKFTNEEKGWYDGCS